MLDTVRSGTENSVNRSGLDTYSGIGCVRRYPIFQECLFKYAQGQSLLFAQILFLVVRERLEQFLQLLNVAVEIVNTKFLVDLRQLDFVD